MSPLAATTGAPGKGAERLRGDMAVYCPNCGSYKGTVDGLRLGVQWLPCATGCISAEKQGSVIVGSGGGEKFPIRYNTDHIKDGSGVIPELVKLGYGHHAQPAGLQKTQFSGELGGEGTGGYILHGTQPDVHQSQSLDVIIARKPDFLGFVRKHKPHYIQVTEGGKSELLELKKSDGTTAVGGGILARITKLLARQKN